MRILVGTLFSFENDIDNCINAIKFQSHKNINHFIIKNLPNQEAHSKLYSTFMDESSNYDLFIKIDADMVLVNEYIFEKIIIFLQRNKSVKCLKLAVHDYFANRLISGMHIYRSTVKWFPAKSQLFLDINNTSLQPSETLSIMSKTHLTPSAIHCPNPSNFQSFHYGVHKALKILQPESNNYLIDKANYHWNIVEDIRRHLLKTNDIKLYFAILGAELTFQGNIFPNHLDYGNPYLIKLFKQYEQYSILRLKHDIFFFKLNKFGYLPHKLRRIFLCGTKYITALNKSKTN